MSRYYGRAFEILVDDEPFIDQSLGVQFRVTFDITLDFGGFLSYADITIANLSESTAARVLKRGKIITVRAGYTDTIDVIFRGQVRNAFKERTGGTVITRVIARGGSQPDSTVSRTLGTDTSLVDIIRACAAAMGYPLVIRSSDFDDVSLYARGYTLDGDPRVYLDHLAQTHGFSYVIENDRLVINRDTSYREGTPVVINERNGMEGIPEITEIGCDVSVRLNPDIRIGRRVDIQSNLSTFNFSNLYFQNIPEGAGKGIYRVFKVQHSGDSWGEVWTSKITGYR